MKYDIPANVMALPVTDDELRRAPKPVIVNVVATYDLWNTTIDPETLTLRLPGFGFNPQRFAAMKMRLGRAMTLAFAGGRAVCPGARRVMDARMAALQFTGLLLAAGEPVCHRSFRIQNIVCSCSAPFEIELVDISNEYSGNAEYKTDKFPGLSFRMPRRGNQRRGIVFNIFVTGEVVITGTHAHVAGRGRSHFVSLLLTIGSRDYEESARAWWWLYTYVLLRHRRGTAIRSTSSAAYKVQTHRAKDTFAADCDRLVGKYARRADGPLAQSKYAPLMRTPRTGLGLATPARTAMVPATPDHGMSSSSSSSQQGVRVLLHRMEHKFPGHTIHCPFVRGSIVSDRPAELDDDRASDVWQQQVRDMECAVAGLAAAPAAVVLQDHVQAGCMGKHVLVDANAAQEAMYRCIAQLYGAANIDDDEPESKVQPAVPRSALQPMEEDDVLDIEAQLVLDQYRAAVARAGNPAVFCP